jgi:hypothetical protein
VPRRNSNVVEKKREFHGATQYHTGYREGCAACPFVGYNFACTTSDSKCLKSNKNKKRTGKKRGKNKWKKIL